VKRPIVISLAILLAACAPKTTGVQAAGDVLEMSVERLPDLNVPRNAHTAAFVNGELMVIGGHTTGFIPTKTAEYYSNGAWHLIDSYFPHDYGFGVVLSPEEILVGGGCAEAFGEGQTQGVELYSALTHSFTPLPIMDQRRTRPTAARLTDGTVLISGNWYYADYTSSYSISNGPETVRRSALQRTAPYIFQTSPDNAIIFSSAGTEDEKLEPIAERLQGEPFEIPLLQEWEDWTPLDGGQMSQFFIGDEAVGGYAWLFPAIRKADGQPGLIKVIGEDFSVLETERPLSLEGPEGEELTNHLVFLADRENSCAWIVQSILGMNRIYVTKVEYGKALRGGKAPVALYRADLPEDLPGPYTMNPVLLPGGRIAFMGGRPGLDEYYPIASAFILHTEPLPAKHSRSWWLGLIAGILCASALVLISWRLQVVSAKKKKAEEVEQGEALFTDMMTRIRALMEEKELFRKPDLKVEDLAAELGTNAAYVRGCIGGAYGGTFSDFVNEYRIRYVQRLLLANPTAKITALAEDAGFSSNATFYRHFSAVTGLSPAAWLKQQQSDKTRQV
jgi:AraC-like DNA-binding protein